jgi:hypothetical protein
LSASLAAAARYLALVFGLGFVLGPVRVMWLEPRLGAAGAVLLEAVPMLAAMFLAARWSLRRSPGASPVVTGLVALAGLLVLEALLAAALARLAPLALPSDAADAIGLALKLAFAAMPLVAAR